MLPIFQIGSLALPVPALIILAALWVGLSFTERFSPRHKIKPDDLYNLTLTMLLLGLVGARLSYAAQHPSAFQGNLSSLMSRNLGLFDPIGGAALALFGGVIFGQRKKLHFWPTLDALTPFLATLGMAIPLANLASGNGFGSPTSLPWGIDLWNASRHPSQIYEFIGAAIIFWRVWPTRQPKKSIASENFISFVAYSAGARLLLEAFRGDSIVFFGGLRAAQMGSLLVLANALWGYSQLHYSKKGEISR